MQASFEPFTECTGVDVEYEASREFEAQLLVRVKAGNAPDIAFLPQPGLLQTIVRDTGTIVPAPDAVSKNVDDFFEASWKDYGTVDGVFYAAPMDANVKSYVWYSPTAFADAGYEVPETWDDLMALSEQYSEDNDGMQPWCAGVESGDATGWPGTDWVEDMMLRTAGPDVYDQWYKHEIPFNDPQVVTAFDAAARCSRTRRWSTRASVRSTRSPRPRGRTPASACWTEPASSTAQRTSTRRSSPKGPTSPRKATSSPSTCPPTRPTSSRSRSAARSRPPSTTVRRSRRSRRTSRAPTGRTRRPCPPRTADG
ncbi:ABC transporter substrate-binding protein [Oerskovia sp. M15]